MDIKRIGRETWNKSLIRLSHSKPNTCKINVEFVILSYVHGLNEILKYLPQNGTFGKLKLYVENGVFGSLASICLDNGQKVTLVV